MNIDMTKNTAVDWLITQIRNQAQNGTLDALVITELRKQAKAMEREQIVDAYWNGSTDLSKDKAIEYAKEFYMETYGGDK